MRELVVVSVWVLVVIAVTTWVWSASMQRNCDRDGHFVFPSGEVYICGRVD